MKKFLPILIIVFSFLLVNQAKAVCPVCTVAVGAGVGLAQELGVDDVISGIWIGALTMSLALWTINWLNKKNINFKAKRLITIISSYVIVVLPLYFLKNIWHPFNILWGVNKLVLGIVMGSIVFSIGGSFYEYLKKKNNGHAHFPFEKVVLPITPLIILSIVFYYITK